MSRYHQQNESALADHGQQGKLHYWYVHSFLWGRHTGSTESVINQDLAAIEGTKSVDGAAEGTDPLDRLIDQLRRSRGDLTVRESDFAGWSLGTRFYPLLYLLTRVWGARDWGNGNALSKHLLGQSNSLQLHHVFPKAYLYRNGYDKAEANALANFALLTAKTNQELSDRPPHEYFEEVEKRQPGALESQWIPMSLADEPAWLSSVAGVPREDLADELTKLAERGRADRLVFTRWALVMYRFEKALYEDPDRADLGVLWWDLIERLQIQERPPGREGAPDWAAKVHLSVAPVYYHNYLLGHMFAAQLRNYLETRVSDGPFFQDEMAGRYLQEAVLGPGARNAWGETVLGATGERLDPEHFVASFRR